MAGVSEVKADAIVSAYREGWSLRQCAKQFDMTPEGIRLVLKRRGESLRPSGGGGSRINDLAEEIFGDLEDHFGGQCTLDEMQQWLGESPERIGDAIRRLERCRWIDIKGDIILALDREAKHAARNHERNAVIMDLFASGMTRRAIAKELGLTINTVTGVVWRTTTMGVPRPKTPRHVRVLSAIKELTKDGVAPTVREIATHLGLRGLQGVHTSICQLEQAGAISRHMAPGRCHNRGISIVEGPRA